MNFLQGSLHLSSPHSFANTGRGILDTLPVHIGKTLWALGHLTEAVNSVAERKAAHQLSASGTKP
jgi:hypothetical protein